MESTAITSHNLLCPAQNIAEPSWSDLPPEILKKIFFLVSSEQLRRLYVACSYFRNIVRSDVVLSARALHQAVFKGVFHQLSCTKDTSPPDQFLKAAAALFVHTQGERAYNLALGYDATFQKRVGLSLVKNYPEQALKIAEEQESISNGEVFVRRILARRNAPPNEERIVDALIDCHFLNKELMQKILQKRYLPSQSLSKLQMMQKLEENPDYFRRQQPIISTIMNFGEGGEIAKTGAVLLLPHASLLYHMGKKEKAKELLGELKSALPELSKTPFLFGFFQTWLLIDTQEAKTCFLTWIDKNSKHTLKYELLILFATKCIDEDTGFSFKMVDCFLESDAPPSLVMQPKESLKEHLPKFILHDFEKGVSFMEKAFSTNEVETLAMRFVLNFSKTHPLFSKKMCDRYPKMQFRALCILVDQTVDEKVRQECIIEIEEHLRANKDQLIGDELHKKRAKGLALFDREEAKKELSLIEDPKERKKAEMVFCYTTVIRESAMEGLAYLQTIEQDKPRRDALEKSIIPCLSQRELHTMLHQAKVNEALRADYLAAISERILPLIEQTSDSMDLK